MSSSSCFPEHLESADSLPTMKWIGMPTFAFDCALGVYLFVIMLEGKRESPWIFHTHGREANGNEHKVAQPKISMKGYIAINRQGFKGNDRVSKTPSWSFLHLHAGIPRMDLHSRFVQLLTNALLLVEPIALCLGHPWRKIQEDFWQPSRQFRQKKQGNAQQWEVDHHNHHTPFANLLEICVVFHSNIGMMSWSCTIARTSVIYYWPTMSQACAALAHLGTPRSTGPLSSDVSRTNQRTPGGAHQSLEPGGKPADAWPAQLSWCMIVTQKAQTHTVHIEIKLHMLATIPVAMHSPMQKYIIYTNL